MFARATRNFVKTQKRNFTDNFGERRRKWYSNPSVGKELLLVVVGFCCFF
jgi:hypothetical protein